MFVWLGERKALKNKATQTHNTHNLFSYNMKMKVEIEGKIFVFLLFLPVCVVWLCDGYIFMEEALAISRIAARSSGRSLVTNSNITS